MDPLWIAVNLLVGWAAILVGLLTGAGIGLFFYGEDWLGGYGSWRRRMLRLAHVAMVGTGPLNIAFALTARDEALWIEMDRGLNPAAWLASALLVLGAVAMPLVCLLSAWRKGMRHLFFIPVACLVIAIVFVLSGARCVMVPHNAERLQMNIGLIAMSGVRACDAELLRLGLTLPGFVERSKTIASLPSLGLLTLAGLTPAEHQCRYLEVEDIRKLDVLPNGFDLVAISSFSAEMGEGYELADRYRAAGTPVVLGGLHATALPEEAAAHADAVVVGEGEAVWPEVLRDAESRRLRPLYRADGQFDLAEAPMPAFHLLDFSKYNRLTVQASRGCPFCCEFCASSRLLTSRYKQKPAERVLAEIDRICELWQHPFLEFADDNAFVNKRYWKGLLAELASRHVHWFAETDLSVHEDEELLTLARQSGCAELLIGLESPSEAALAGLELVADWKRKQWPHYGEAVRRIQRTASA